MFNFLLAVLVRKNLISQEEAEKLSKQLALEIHPTDFKTAQAIVERILKELDTTI